MIPARTRHALYGLKRLLRPDAPVSHLPAAPTSDSLPAPAAAPEPTVLSVPATLRLRNAPLHEFFDRGDADPKRPFRCLRSLPGEAVALPPLPIGDRMLGAMEVRETPTSWRHPDYHCVEGLAFEGRGVVLHGSAGILGVSGMVLADSLMHTDPVRHRYRRQGEETVLLFDELRMLPGTYISLLSSASDNYFHAILDGIARLALITDDDLVHADGILIPAQGCAADALAHYPLPPNLTVRRVAADETLLVDRLILPHTLHGVIHFHPALLTVFDTISARIPLDGVERPKRIYIDRRGAGARPMANEDAVTAALQPLGFEALRLEGLGFDEQVRLFREAEYVVAPHGAGLANLVFARPGCRVLELGIDAYLHEAFRRIAALRGLTYDCVIGRTRRPWPEPHAFIEMAWEAPLDEIVAAVGQGIEQSSKALNGLPI